MRSPPLGPDQYRSLLSAGGGTILDHPAYRSGFVANRLRFPHWCFPGNAGVALLIEELNGKRNGRVILIMQRLHEDDLAGYVLAQESWDVVSFPAIAEVDATYVIESPFGSSTHHRRAGDVLDTEREPLATLVSVHIISPAGNSERRRPPAAARYRRPRSRAMTSGIGRKSKQIVQGWDAAHKPSELVDYYRMLVEKRSGRAPPRMCAQAGQMVAVRDGFFEAPGEHSAEDEFRTSEAEAQISAKPRQTPANPWQETEGEATRP